MTRLPSPPQPPTLSAARSARSFFASRHRKSIPASSNHAAHEPTLSGFNNQPRPFVLRASELDNQSFEPDRSFALQVLTFDPAGPTADWFPRVFKAIAEEGLGPTRARLDLVSAQHAPQISIDIDAPQIAPVAVFQIQFLTPTELKHQGTLLREPHFAAVFTRARDRVSALCKLYQEGSPEADYRLLNTTAQEIQLTASHIEQHEVSRRSSRTGQHHQLGGFTGQATYQGDLTRFLPWLKAAEWTGIGRYTAWGNGRIQLSTA